MVFVPRGSVRKSRLSHLLTLIKPYWLRLLVALIALVIGSLINLTLPEVVRRALSTPNFSASAEQLRSSLLVLGLLFCLQGVVFYVRSLYFGLLGQQVYADVRNRLLRAVIGREIAFFDQNRSADLASRLNSDAALVQDLVSVKLSVMLRYGAQVLFGTVLMAWMSWRMTLAILLSVLCMVGVSSIFVRTLRAASREFQSALGTLTAFAAESLAGVRIIRALGAEPSVLDLFSSKSQQVLDAGRTRVGISAAFSSGASLLLNILMLAVIGYGASLVLSGSMNFGDLAAFALYGSIVGVSFAFLVSGYVEVVQALGGLERVFELWEEQSNGDETTSNLIKDSGPTVECREVDFAYPTADRGNALNKLSLKIPGGAVVGIMGPSGAGKSSLVQLLLKFYAPVSGQLLINGCDLNHISRSEVCSKIAWVPQEPHLFGFSILENLNLGDLELSVAEIEQRLRAWKFVDFIWELPCGLSMTLGEHGTKLSGGQKQRLAIARALLRSPQLLILDEATSALDSESESLVLKALRDFLPRSTVIIVSHRLSTVRHADQIFVISDGRVVEKGTHNSLREASGLYRHYAQLQMQGA